MYYPFTAQEASCTAIHEDTYNKFALKVVGSMWSRVNVLFTIYQVYEEVYNIKFENNLFTYLKPWRVLVSIVLNTSDTFKHRLPASLIKNLK